VDKGVEVRKFGKGSFCSRRKVIVKTKRRNAEALQKEFSVRAEK
jgi:hypothetical protein